MPLTEAQPPGSPARRRTGRQDFALAIADGAKTDSLGNPAVSALLKTHSGKRYLLAASSAESGSHIQVKAAGLGGKVEVLFEGRTVTARNGAFDDDFAPYAVHVYQW